MVRFFVHINKKQKTDGEFLFCVMFRLTEPRIEGKLISGGHGLNTYLRTFGKRLSALNWR